MPLSDAYRTTYGPFGERYDIDQWQPPTIGGVDPMTMLPMMRGARAAGALRQLPGLLRDNAGAAHMATEKALPITPGILGMVNELINNPAVHQQEEDRWRKRFSGVGNLAGHYGDRLQAAGQAARSTDWFNRGGGIQPLPGAPY